MPWTAVASRHAELDAQRQALEARLAAMAPPPVLTMHPGVAQAYREAVETLSNVLDRPTADAAAANARNAVRALIRRVTVHPLEGPARYELAIDLELSALLADPRAPLSVNGTREPFSVKTKPSGVSDFHLAKVAGFWVE